MSYMVNPHIFGGVVELARDTDRSSNVSNNSTYTSSDRNIGAASPTRRVFALIFGFAVNSSRTLSSVTIGGISATIHAQVTGTNSGDAILTAIASAVVPTGTTAAVVANFSNTMNAFACAIIALDGLQSSTPVDTATATSASASVTGTGLDCSDGGYAMAVAATSARAPGTVTCAWTNVTETVDVSLNDVDGTADYMGFTVAYQSALAASSFDVTATFNTPVIGKSLTAISVR